MIFNFHLQKWMQWFLPYTCLLCNNLSERQQDLCLACYNTLPLAIYSCARCAKVLPDTHLHLVCGNCLKHPPPFQAAFALYTYQPPISTLILSLKFREALVNARVLGELMAEKILQEWYHNSILPDVIVPVPLHPSRLRERGFNQALEIARPIAKKLKCPINMTSERTRATAAQATLPADQRKQNIKNAFRINESFKGKYVAILDDVITTGQTVSELGKALKRAGAKKIDVWCCARPDKL